jgi:L-serine dehydratase
MFISVLDLFKIGIGPSSSHTLGPMVAANDFINLVEGEEFIKTNIQDAFIRCTLKGSLAFTGKGHSTDRAVASGLHGYLPTGLLDKDVSYLIKEIWDNDHIDINKNSWWHIFAGRECRRNCT